MAYEVISRQSAPASNIFDFTGLSFTDFEGVQIKLQGLVVGTDDADILFQVYVGGVLVTTGYHVASNSTSTSGSTEDMFSTSTTSIPLNDTTAVWGVGNATGENLSGLISLYNPTVAVNKLFGILTEHVLPSGNTISERSGGKINNTGTIDGFKISTSTGTLTAGVVVVQGARVS
jgi:hypothetical protein